MADMPTTEMFQKAWDNSINYSKRFYFRSPSENECYIWFLDNPKVLMALSPSQHEEMIRDYGDKPEYHFVKCVSDRRGFEAAVDEIAQTCIEKWQG